MVSLTIIMEGEGAWPDLKDKKVTQATHVAVAVLPKGMVSGKPSVALRIETGPGEVTFAETSLALLLTAADAFKARYGDPRS